jgi:hypothetical protein
MVALFLYHDAGKVDCFASKFQITPAHRFSSDSRMVLFKTFVAGACLLVVGVLLLIVLGPYVTIEVRQVQQRSVEPHVEFLVGDVGDRSYSLPGNVPASGIVDVTQAPTNVSGDVRFMIFDEGNYQKWSSGQQSNPLFSADRQGTFIYNFTTSDGGTYHFVFDNRASVFKKYVTLSVGYSEVTVTHVPDPRVPYVAWAVMVGGAVILAYGLTKKSPIPWA